jgi:hypothetical protein
LRDSSSSNAINGGRTTPADVFEEDARNSNSDWAEQMWSSSDAALKEEFRSGLPSKREAAQAAVEHCAAIASKTVRSLEFSSQVPSSEPTLLDARSSVLPFREAAEFLDSLS